MDDVNRILHPCASNLRSCAARHSGIQFLTLARLDSTGGLVDANRVSLSAENIWQISLITVAESKKDQRNWVPHDISFQVSHDIITCRLLLQRKNDCPTNEALLRLNECALSLLESNKRRQ